MTEIWGQTQYTLKTAKISSPKVYHTTMSQKLQITPKSNKIFSAFVEEVFLLSLKAFFFAYLSIFAITAILKST